MELNLIKSISVSKLFGIYDYSFDIDSETLNSDAVILYGDNGVGKSTILRLAFHLLSTSNNNGHRTALSQTNFEKLEVKLSSGFILTAEKGTQKKENLMVLDILKETKVVARWNYYPHQNGMTKMVIDDEIIYLNEEGYDNNLIIHSGKKSSKDPLRNVTGRRIYLTEHKKIVPITFILNADRKLDGDTISDPDDEVEVRQAMRMGNSYKKIQDLVIRSREIALSQALSAATKWIAKKAVQGTNQGSDNVHSTYVRILRQLVSRTGNNSIDIPESEIDTLKGKLNHIGKETLDLAKYELSSFLDMSELDSILTSTNESQKALSAELLTPYIESLDGRLDAVRDIYKILNKFMTTVNELLTDKEIKFKLSQGFSIKNKSGETLLPVQLSSGEQQLLLLFCYVLVARDSSSVFMIDEPEISLNIKWQRILVQSLLDITKGANIQFIFASHSLEIISQHRSSVIILEHKK
ncbi:AAA family ATPase [Providencia sp. PROV196]|uniref:AAA family ATPase n=1 Tax=Providencia sp. PROV196 TaxID=2949897 RepID=UPI00234B83A0|nr:AAA family ATPase [Providencia sp. PROV196]